MANAHLSVHECGAMGARADPVMVTDGEPRCGYI